jgi:hypothetical protein
VVDSVVVEEVVGVVVELVVLVVVDEVGTTLIDAVVDEDGVDARLELEELEEGERTTYAATPPTATMITMTAAMRIGAIPPFCLFI